MFSREFDSDRSTDEMILSAKRKVEKLPEAGKITVYGVPIEEYNKEELIKLFDRLILQNNTLRQ